MNSILEVKSPSPWQKCFRGNSLPIVGLVLCVIAANIPFLNQAFHMDDAIYLLLARNVSRSPWFPQDRPTYFEGLYGRDLASTEHPLPLTSYVLALAAQIGRGFSEVSLHLSFLIFPVILACSMYLLARRFTAYPVLATLSLMFLPVVYVLSHTLMTDIPQLALWVASTALFICGVDSGKRSWVWLAAVAGTLASFVSYSGLCLFPLLSLYAILRKDQRALLIILILPASVFCLWLALSYFHYQRLPPGQLLGFYFLVNRVLSPELLMRKSIYIVLAIGGLTIFPLFSVAFSRKTQLLAGLGFAALAIWPTRAFHYSGLEKVLFVLFFCAGATLMAEIVKILVGTRRFRKDDSRAAEADLFLGIWFLGVIVFSASIYLTGSARYLLPAMPPLVLLLFRRLERTLAGQRLRWVTTANLALGGLLALLIAIADYQFAQIYRDFFSTFERSYPARLNRVWFTGEWGFRAYLEQGGGQELGRRDVRPRPGDLLIVPRLATPYQTLFGDTLSLDSIVLVAPSRVSFDISPLPPGSVLVYTIGMPFHDKSDGVNLCVRFVAPDSNRILYSGRVLPADGRRWVVQQIPLREIAGKYGKIAFSAEVGGSNNDEADWIAVARARICERKNDGEIVLYDFRDHLTKARIEAEPDVQYGTIDNLPVFPMAVWLEQEPATVLRASYDYFPALPVRILDAGVHAGFWCMSWGMLPFSFAGNDSILESIRVYEVSRDVDAYGESTVSWYPQ